MHKFLSQRRQARKTTRAPGFTLVELMITIAVASIMLGIAVPSFRTMMISNRLTTQANDIVSAINLARSEAIKRNRSVSLCRVQNGSDATCETSSGIWTDWIIATNTGDIVRRGRIERYGTALTVRSTLVNDQAAFGSDGLVRTGTGLANDRQFTVCFANGGTNNRRVVTIGAGSRISTQPATGAC
jgi:type IV fimbrial biogenesis protein FimT